jgi:integrase
VDSLPAPEKGQVFVRDTELKGFALRITASGAKSFIVEKRIKGKVRRITLARYPALTVEQARLEAQKQLGAIATGFDPIKARHDERAKSITLHEAFKVFRQARSHLAPKTLYDYQRVMEVAFDDWLSKGLRDISKDMVARRFEELSTKRGPAYANLAMRTLRSLLNFAIARYDDVEGNPILRDNPVLRLTRTGAWHTTKRRQTVIKAHQLTAWYSAVLRLRSERPVRIADTIADYLLVLLFTGLRRNEAARLKWSEIDLEDRTLRVPTTKNGEPLTLPISDFLYDLLATRKEIALSDYVFLGEGQPGPLVEPRAGVKWVAQESNVPFILHDLRRTFITVAESLNIPIYAIKRLVNHKMSHDVTAGYIISDIERLRAPMQKISNYLHSALTAEGSAKVVNLRNARVLVAG